LRFVVGAHFFHEGYSKWRDPKPFSAPVFGGAKGPFAPLYHNLLWDRDGLNRLDYGQTVRQWGVVDYDEENNPQFRGGYLGAAIRHFRFNQDQADEAAGLVMARIRQYEAVLADYAGDIEEYRDGLARRRANAADRSRRLESFQKHDARIGSELMSKRMSWQTEIDKIWQGLETDMNYLADREGIAGRGYLRIDKPGRRWLDSETFDRFIPYFDMTIGVLLVIGLFTRVTASVAAAFLATIIVSQWPFARDALPTGYQQVEMCSLLVLAAVGAGYYAGLDAVLKNCCGFCCKRRATPSETGQIGENPSDTAVDAASKTTGSKT
jgi:hypothetical protein